MSNPVEDYLPFNLKLYTQEILPIWFEALQGHVQPLRKLIDSADHFSMWPHINCPRFISPYDYDHFFVQRFNAITNVWPNSYPIFLEQYPYKKPARYVDLWDILRPIVDTLETSSDPLHVPYQEVLQHCLLYTWGCVLPPDEQELMIRVEGRSMVTSTNGSTLMGIEDLAFWYEYITYDETQSTLWHPFLHRQSLVEYILEHNLLPPKLQLQDPRVAHFRADGEVVTANEVQTILEQDRGDTQRLFATIIDTCVTHASDRDLPLDFSRVKKDETIDTSTGILDIVLRGELTRFDDENDSIIYDELENTYPYLMASFREKAYHQLECVIQSVKARMKFAVEHGLEILMIRD